MIVFPQDNMSDWLELPEVWRSILFASIQLSTDMKQNIKEGLDGTLTCST
jgi:hypothetical protein